MTYRSRCDRRREERQAVQKMRAGWLHLYGIWRPSFSYVKLLRIENGAKKYEEFFRESVEAEPKEKDER